MANIATAVDKLIGKTPLLELTNIEKDKQLSARIIAKLESFNPAGSAKDRIAKKMLDDAEAAGTLKPGATIIEPTSGNTGIGLAAVAAARGYKTIIVMPDTMSVERQKLIAAYGAQIVLTEGAKGMQGAIDKADELASEIQGSFIAGQFVNPSNPQAHYETTGPEIWEDAEGDIDIFVAGIGTGGTLSGVGRFLKEKNPNIQIVGVEPATSAVITTGVSGSHALQGLGAGFIPDTLDTAIYDEVLAAPNDEPLELGSYIAKTEGILVGISSGVALWGALQLAARPENAGKTIVTLFPDTGERYLSTSMFA